MIETNDERPTGLRSFAERVVVVVNHKSIFDPRPEVPGFTCQWVNRNAKTGRTEYVFYPDADQNCPSCGSTDFDLTYGECNEPGCDFPFDQGDS